MQLSDNSFHFQTPLNITLTSVDSYFKSPKANLSSKKCNCPKTRLLVFFVCFNLFAVFLFTTVVGDAAL